MDNTENVIPVPGQFQASQQEQGPRMPKISPKTYEALNALDGYISKASLTRGEHSHAAQCLQFLTKLAEDNELAIKELTSKKEEQRTLQGGSKESTKR